MTELETRCMLYELFIMAAMSEALLIENNNEVGSAKFPTCTFVAEVI